MKKLYLMTLLALLLIPSAFAQLTVENSTDANNPLSSGSWLWFRTGGYATSIVENCGLNLLGSNIQPVQVRNTSLLVGYASGCNNYGQGNAMISGNVGIGTTAPTAKLDVNGIIQTYNKDHNGAYWDNLRMWSDGESSHIESSGDENGLYFKSNTAGKILFLSNVGIGTSDPKGYKLAVAGNAIAESVTVKLQGQWGDYVFKPSYKLRPLSEVKSFIAQNQHLPEIPSAKDIGESGIDLGEMVKLQMKKIEELTLYLIEKDKEIKEMKTEISQMKRNSKHSQTNR